MTRREAVARLEIMLKIIERLPEIDNVYPDVGDYNRGCSIQIQHDDAVAVIERTFGVKLKREPRGFGLSRDSAFKWKASAIVDSVEIFTLLR